MVQGCIFGWVRRSDAYGRRFDGRVALECGDKPRRSESLEIAWNLVLPTAYLFEVSLQDMGICV